MTLIQVDPLAVLPVTAACASAAFARAADPARDHLERQRQLVRVDSSLASVGRLLDRCHQAAAELAAELAAPAIGECGVPQAVCRSCLGVPLLCSGGLGQCRRCKRVTRLPGKPGCPESPHVSVRDRTGAEQAMCVSHAAAAVRQIDGLVIVCASRADRAVLGDVGRESSIVPSHVTALVHLRDGGGRE